MKRALALLLLGGCTTPSVEVARREIVGGTADADDPAVVLWVAQVPRATTATICTASLISPHVLLTAAHCVTPELVGADAQYRYYQGPDVNTASSRELHPIPTVHFHPEFSSTDVQKGHDIAVGVLDVPLTDTAPLTLNTRSIGGDLIGQPARLVGYGKDSGTDTTGASAGVKRQVSTRLNSYSDDLLRFGQSGMTTCEGDSGGPAFMTVDGAERIVGVVSFGDASCAELGVDTRVDVFADDWVRPFVEAADPGFLPPAEHHGCDMGAGPAGSAWGSLALLALLAAHHRRRQAGGRLRHSLGVHPCALWKLRSNDRSVE